MNSSTFEVKINSGLGTYKCTSLNEATELVEQKTGQPVVLRKTRTVVRKGKTLPPTWSIFKKVMLEKGIQQVLANVRVIADD